MNVFFLTNYNKQSWYSKTGDIMKKVLIRGVVYVIIGYILGSFLFKSKLELIKNITSKELYYFLEEGKVGDKEILENKVSNLTTSVIDYKNNDFYIYRGITKDLDAAKKVKKILEDKGFSITIKEKYLNNQEFSTTITQFDNLINTYLTTDEILKVEEVILSTYEEVVKNNKD